MTIRFLSVLLVALVAFASPALADSNLGCSPISNAIDPTEAQATDDYVNLADGTFGTSVTADDEFIVGTDVIVWGLTVDTATAPGGTDTWDITVMDDGVATPVTCEILGTATSCRTTIGQRATVARGSDLTVLIDSGNGATDPTATAEIRFGFCVSVK